MNTFKLGQAVNHPLYGTGQVCEVDEGKKLISVFFPSRMGYVSVHPASLTAVEDSDSL